MNILSIVWSRVIPNISFQDKSIYHAFKTREALREKVLKFEEKIWTTLTFELVIKWFYSGLSKEFLKTMWEIKYGCKWRLLRDLQGQFRAIKFNTFHGVNISWYPYFVALSLFYALLSLANYFNFGEGYIDMHLAIIFTSWFFFGWFFEWNELVLEGYASGEQERIGFADTMILIFISETLLFASLFWAWFNTILSCEPLGGYSWPAVGNEYPNPFTVVYFNTVILIYSGIAVTALHAMRAFNIVYNLYTYDLFVLMNVAATLFSIYQEVEHMDLLMSINSVCIGCHFFFLTGLHGLHVNIGAFLLLYLFISTWFAEQEKNVGFDFEMTALYWHFVDVVWIFLFITVYWWGFF